MESKIGQPQSEGESLQDRLERHPILKARFEGLLNLVDGINDVRLADDAERQVVDALRAMGNELLTDWGKTQASLAAGEAKKQGAVKHQKKKLCWHSTFGEIEVEEQIFLSRRKGEQIRPFSRQAQITPRAYSLLLQRAITDFGADEPFAKVVVKVHRHYGIDISPSAAPVITLKHARKIENSAELPVARKLDPKQPVPVLIAEIDGCMVPVAQTAEPGTIKDRRKGRTLLWKELKLCLVRRHGEVIPLFGATTKGPEEMGVVLKQVAQCVGLSDKTHVHGVGDGAPWICNQFEAQFGMQASYLVDLYHICDYLAAAAKVCCPADPVTWAQTQKDRLKTNQPQAVLEALVPWTEPVDAKDETPVADCHRYISNRLGQLDYADAIQNKLPVGSGEIESAHRYVIQNRIKLPGAWWKLDNISAMAALCVSRANNAIDRYWDHYKTAT